jgi:hypothetical protein
MFIQRECVDKGCLANATDMLGRKRARRIQAGWADGNSGEVFEGSFAQAAVIGE